jgi:hypothetical protein
MAKLSDSQLVVLSTACQRPDGCVFPVTLKLKGNAVGNVLKSLLTKGFLEEVPGRADDTVWRHDDGAPLTLQASRAAYDELGIEPETDPTTEGRHAAAIDDGGLVGGTPAEQGIVAAKIETRVRKTDQAPRTRGDSKQAKLIEMLKRPEGASIEEIVAAFDWQAHTVRGAIAGALKKKLGLDVTSEKIDGRGRVYRIA